MNENNQPQSQQTKREPGYYWVRQHKGSMWAPAYWMVTISGSFWTIDGVTYEKDKNFKEIDECRIERQPSHSPTEQPGDAGFNKLVMDTFHELYPYSSGPHLNELFVMAERATKYVRSKQAKLVAWNQKLREYITAEREISQRFTDENAKLRSERDKMREALEKITDYVDPLSAHNAFYIMREIAKSALSGGSKQ